MQKICVIYNTAPRYREAVFRAIDKEYDCDWYFGKTKSDIKEMDTSLLKNVTYYKHTVILKNGIGSAIICVCFSKKTTRII